MEIIKVGIAGTMESSDIMITLEPNKSGGLEIILKSSVEKQFGRKIKSVISETLLELGVTNAKITAVDKGALDCAVRARVKTAAFRSTEKQSYAWGGTL